MASIRIAKSHVGYLYVNQNPPEFHSFTHHKKSALIPLMLGLCLAIVVETIAVHFLIAMWNEIVAWIVTLSSLYFLLFLIVHIRAVQSKTTYLTDCQLVLRNGLFGHVSIELSNIRSVRNMDQRSDQQPEPFGFSVPLTSNLVIELHDEVCCELAFGLKKRTVLLSIYLDESDQFAEMISSRLSQLEDTDTED